MAAGSTQVTVGTTPAVLLAQAPVVQVSGPAASVLVANGSGAIIYLGGPNVSAANGYALATSTALALTLHSGSGVYAVTSAGSSTVSVLIT